MWRVPVSVPALTALPTVVGLAGGTHPLLDITQHPWTELGKKKNNFKPLNPDLIAEIDRRWDIYFAPVDGGGDSQESRTRHSGRIPS